MKITVTFNANERLLEAGLYLPDIDTKDALPGLLFEGSMTGATAQITEYMARQISRQGFACMVLDHSFYGENELSPQPWESPAKRIEDIKAGLRFLQSQATVDPEKIIGIGVSVGAEFLGHAIRETDICKGFVMVEGPYDDAENYVGELEIPTVVVDEDHLDSAIDQTILWVRTMWDGNRQWPSRDKSIDWSLMDQE